MRCGEGNPHRLAVYAPVSPRRQLLCAMALAETLAASVIVVVADGVRVDTLKAAIDAGTVPALARLARDGGLHEITTVFPSVTGIAYIPFVAGRHPAPAGLPGLRWYDREHHDLPFPHYTRSYMGWSIRHMDRDLDPGIPTLFELAQPSMGAMTMVGRGLRRRDWIGRGVPYQLRAARTHWTGNLQQWLDLDQHAGHHARQLYRTLAPRYALAAFLGADKASHSEGHQSPHVEAGLRIVDDFVAQLRAGAEEMGRAETTRIQVVSDHGHSPVLHHEDLAGVVADTGVRVIAHPWVYSLRKPEVAVMVSGNAMSHIYLDLQRRTRVWWPDLASRWEPLATMLTGLDSVDLVLLPTGAESCEIRSRTRGSADVSRSHGRYSYRLRTGDPLGIGAHERLDTTDAYNATIASDYPDGLVQVIALACSRRAGEIVLSASRNWDFRAKYEPIPHLSSHGAMHREHMMVPLLLDRPPARAPKRTIDLMPSACDLLGIRIPAGVMGESFV